MMKEEQKIIDFLWGKLSLVGIVNKLEQEGLQMEEEK